jgi:hypothetical protein
MVEGFGFGYTFRQGAKTPNSETSLFFKPLRLGAFAGDLSEAGCGYAALRAVVAQAVLRHCSGRIAHVATNVLSKRDRKNLTRSQRR